MRKITIALSAVALALVCGLAGIGFYIGLTMPPDTLPPETMLTTAPTETSRPGTTAPTTQPVTVPTTTPATVPTTIPTEPPTVSTEPPTVPTEHPTVPTEPTEPPTQSTEPPAEPPTEPTQPEGPKIPKISSRYAFVYDYYADALLFVQGGMDESFAPASITKLFTAWVGLQYLPLNTVITVGEEVTWIDPDSSRAQLKPGYQITAEMCVQAMIIRSGNDAAYTWAVAAGRAIAGDPALPGREAIDVFMAEMNRKAQEMGLSGTHFVNPDGITADGHYMTLNDLLKISKIALETPVIRQASATQKLQVTCLTGQTLEWVNSNMLLHPEMEEYYCPEAMGLKTGSTMAAGKCLVAVFQDGDRLLMVCVMGCPDDDSRFGDARALFEAFRKS